MRANTEGRSCSSSDLNHRLLLLALWSCGRRVSVAQAQRQIHRAHPGRPHRRWSLVTQGLVRPAVVVKADPLANADARLKRVDIDPQMDLFVLQAAPQPLDEDVIQPAPAPVHGSIPRRFPAAR